jgi:peptide/nickel transport system ATP-binding protein
MSFAEEATRAGAGRTDVLSVEHLSVSVDDLTLVEEVGFSLRAGERVGMIGESGSGKSLTALSIMGLLSEGVRATGSVRVGGTDLIGADESTMSRVRGRDIAMIFQEPMTALNPTMRVGKQVGEGFLIHKTRPDRRAAAAAAVELLAQVGLPDPAMAARAYPHQLSGGQRQRVMIAMALANDPSVLVCDEPTTALDVTVQARVLDLITRTVTARNAAMLFITHDLGVVATLCERVMVMYGGRIIESGSVRDVFTRPRHRYTKGLIDASNLDVVDSRGRLATIPGSVPGAGRFPAGCAFRDRCGAADEACHEQPEWTSTSEPYGYACFHPVSELKRGMA